MVEVKKLFKRYGDFTAVNDLNFSVAKGEILGFLGPNGAGKTTTMRILTGFLPATSGSVSIAGFDVFASPIETKKRIGYLPESPPVYQEMTVQSYLKFICQIKGVSKAKAKESIEWAMEKCGLTHMRMRLIGNLSKGYRQRVGLAQAIVHNPELLILDEPTVGLDPKQIREIRDLIKGLAGDHTVILSTHILPEVSMTCEKVVIINHGHVAAEGTIEELTREKSLEEVFIDLISKEPVTHKEAPPSSEGSQTDSAQEVRGE